LSSYNPDTHGQPGKYFDSLVVELQKAQKLLTDSARLLLSYQLEKAQATINQLKAAIEDKRVKVEPKKKFAFKSEKKKTAVQVIFACNLVIIMYNLTKNCSMLASFSSRHNFFFEFKMMYFLHKK